MKFDTLDMETPEKQEFIKEYPHSEHHNDHLGEYEGYQIPKILQKKVVEDPKIGKLIQNTKMYSVQGNIQFSDIAMNEEMRNFRPVQDETYSQQNCSTRELEKDLAGQFLRYLY